MKEEWKDGIKEWREDVLKKGNRKEGIRKFKESIKAESK